MSTRRRIADQVQRRLRQLPITNLRRTWVDLRVSDRLAYGALATLLDRYGEKGRGLTGSELKVFSQNGEDGVIAEIFRRIGVTERYFVEFGSGPGTEGNCVFPADVLGWRGLFIEASGDDFRSLQGKYQHQPSIVTLCALVTPRNVEELFRRAGVPAEFDLLSIDIDGNDYWVWSSIDEYSPRLVVIEYNSSLDPQAQLVQPDSPSTAWDGTNFFGASLGALVSLAESKGYVLVHTELTGTNAFFVRADYASAFGDIAPVGDRGTNFGLRAGAHPKSDGPAPYVTVGDADAPGEPGVKASSGDSKPEAPPTGAAD